MLTQCKHQGPYLFAAKLLVPCMLPQGLIGTGAPISQPTADQINPGRFKLASSKLVWLPILMLLIDTN